MNSQTETHLHWIVLSKLTSKTVHSFFFRILLRHDFKYRTYLLLKTISTTYQHQLLNKTPPYLASSSSNSQRISSGRPWWKPGTPSFLTRWWIMSRSRWRSMRHCPHRRTPVAGYLINRIRCHRKWIISMWVSMTLGCFH